MENKILLIGGTHGDEPIGVRALQELAKERSDFDWIIGNEPALKQNTREFEGNLNRSAPGDKNSPLYASRRAAEILKIAKNYKYVIDLHGTNQQTGIFIIITNSKPENWQLAAKLPIQNIVYWPSFSCELSGPLSEFLPCGLEIECGPKNDPKTTEELKKILKNFLNGEKKSAYRARSAFAELRRTQSALICGKRQKVFEVYGSYSGQNINLKEFKLTKIENEEFCPLLIGVYPEITCYKMKKIN